MAYTTRNIVNRLVRKQLHVHLNHVVSERTEGGINLYIELEKHKLNQICSRNMRTSLDKTYSFLEVKLRRLRRKTYKDKYDIHDKNLHSLLYLHAVLITIYDVSKHVHGIVQVLSLD